MKPVLTKADFVVRYAAGEFGNASPTWDNYNSWALGNGEQYGELFHIRSRVAGGLTWYNVPTGQLKTAWTYAKAVVGSTQLYISAMAPTKLTLFQGEAQRGVWGTNLYYSTVPKPMREALREDPRSAQGIIARSLLQKYLDPPSQEWLENLLDTYEGHVVEFSTYGKEWGTVPGYNTVFWEVRSY